MNFTLKKTHTARERIEMLHKFRMQTKLIRWVSVWWTRKKKKATARYQQLYTLFQEMFLFFLCLPIYETRSHINWRRTAAAIIYHFYWKFVFIAVFFSGHLLWCPFNQSHKFIYFSVLIWHRCCIGEIVFFTSADKNGLKRAEKMNMDVNKWAKNGMVSEKYVWFIARSFLNLSFQHYTVEAVQWVVPPDRLIDASWSWAKDNQRSIERFQIIYGNRLNKQDKLYCSEDHNINFILLRTV